MQVTVTIFLSFLPGPAMSTCILIFGLAWGTGEATVRVVVSTTRSVSGEIMMLISGRKGVDCRCSGKVLAQL